MPILSKLLLSLLLCGQCLNSYADPNSKKESHFPINLSFKLDAANKALEVEILNSGDRTLIVDLMAVKSIQLVYWFTVDGKVISPGYETPTIQDAMSGNFSERLNAFPERFIQIRPNEELRHKIPLDDFLKIFHPFSARFPNNDFVGMQLFASGIAVGNVEDGKVSFKDDFFRSISAARPLAVTKQEIQEMLNDSGVPQEKDSPRDAIK